MEVFGGGSEGLTEFVQLLLPRVDFCLRTAQSVVRVYFHLMSWGK